MNIKLTSEEQSLLINAAHQDLRTPEDEIRWFLKTGLHLRELSRKSWRSNLDERQSKEVEFCQLYLKDFSHGTDGHNAKIIIAKLAQLLDEYQAIIRSETLPKNI